MPPTRPLAALALVAVVGLVGCGESQKEKESKANQPTAEGTQKVKGPKVGVEIIDPTPNDRVGNDTFIARVRLTGFKLDPAAVGKAAKPGEGHLHFSLDKGKFDYPKNSGENGKQAQQLGVQGKYSPATEPQIRYRDIPKGKHTLEVVLANNDHTNAGPKASVTFTVTKTSRGGG